VLFIWVSESYIRISFVKWPFTESNDIDKIKEYDVGVTDNYGANKKLIQNVVKTFEQKMSF
jgi:hypothetical protein